MAKNINVTIEELKARKLNLHTIACNINTQISEVDNEIAYALCGIKIGTIIRPIKYEFYYRMGEVIIGKSPHHVYERITNISVDGEVVKFESEFFYNSATKRDEYYRREMTEWSPFKWRIVDEGFVEAMIQRDELMASLLD